MRVLARLADWLATACAALLAVMLAVAFVQVVMRYFLREPFVWGEELARYLQIWLTFLGAAACIGFGGHMAVDALVRVLPPRARVAVNVIVGLGSAAFFLALTVVGVRLVAFVWEDRSPALSAPFGIVYLSLPIGAALSFLLTLGGLWSQLSGAAREPSR